MTTSHMSGAVQYLRRAVLRPDGVGPTDGQLLAAFITRHDDAALAALVRRHAPMVWGVCRRVLRNHHDAEDAFQATFLVLVRRAASIASGELLANWLYGVARRTAMKARAAAAKRKGRERQAAAVPEPAVVERDLWDDLRPLLDQELGRLPGGYRAVVVLCDLEGKTRKEAARQLGVAEGTVASRLARARVMLAKRLARRGGVGSCGAVAAMLSQNAGAASVPAFVVAHTITVASLVAAGRAVAGLVPVNVAALSEGVLKAMFLTKLKIVLPVVLVAAVALAGVGAGGLLRRTQAGEPPAVAGKEEQVAGAKGTSKPAGAADGDGEPAFPVAPPPLQAFASAVKGGRAMRGGKEVQIDLLGVTVRGEDKDENPPPPDKAGGGKARAPARTTYYDLDAVHASDTKGKRIGAKELVDLLRTKTAVLVSADGRPVDAVYLQLIKDGTVVLVLQPGKATADKRPLTPPAVAADRGANLATTAAFYERTGHAGAAAFYRQLAVQENKAKTGDKRDKP